MGVEGLSKLLRDSKILSNHINELSGLMIGVDGFVLLHRMILNKACVREFHQFPPTGLYIHVSDETYRHMILTRILNSILIAKSIRNRASYFSRLMFT